MTLITLTGKFSQWKALVQEQVKFKIIVIIINEIPSYSYSDHSNNTNYSILEAWGGGWTHTNKFIIKTNMLWPPQNFFQYKLTVLI